MPVVQSDAPCGVDASLWRECLKTFDYSPERPQGACEKQRGAYYSCIKDWKLKTTGEKYQAKDFYTHPKCKHEAETFHNCMMMRMFEVSNCKDSMVAFKACGARNDPSIAQALSDDAEVQEYLRQQREHTGLSLWWKKAIGKA